MSFISPAQPPHESAVCARENQVHFHGTSWSDSFKCPVCGRRGRYNLNFLGPRRVFCDGAKFTLVRKDT